MKPSTFIWGALVLGGAATATVLVLRARRAGPQVSVQPDLGTAAPAPNPPTAAPLSELEPDDDWERTYEQRFGYAVQRCIDDPQVIAFDRAVVVALEEIFPAHGSFSLTPATGQWKRLARERARQDLADALGHTEAQARATLSAPVGRQALARGADLGQAVREMAQHAFPAAAWSDPSATSWQTLFCEAAAAHLRSSGPTSAHPDAQVASVA